MEPDDDESRYPVLVFDGSTEPSIAATIWHAQQAGWPKVLTYMKHKDGVLRRMAMHSPEGEVPRIDGQRLHRDEYPFHCTAEHKGSAWIGHAVAAENRSQGGRLRAFLQEKGALAGAKNHPDGFKFAVRVANWPPPPPRTR